MKTPFFSIVIATYNSQKTLEYTLKSIKEQTIAKDEVEIIVVDGGSTDETLEIARMYEAQIVDNPKRLPEYAKAIGIQHCHGHFVIRMDSDEEFIHKDQLQKRMDFLMENPDIKVFISNLCLSGRKDICGISADYMNIFGDPFSYFVYKTKQDKYHTYQRNVIKKDGENIIMNFERRDVYPLADSATSMICLDYMMEHYPEEYTNIDFVCHAYDRVLQDSKLCGFILSDGILHNCNSSLKTFFSKLKFRVVNNLFHKEESGFSAKEEMNDRLKKRKLLFCFYVMMIPLPILDSIRLAIRYKNPTFLLHFIYTYYICFQIAYLGCKKMLGKNVDNYKFG